LFYDRVRTLLEREKKPPSARQCTHVSNSLQARTIIIIIFERVLYSSSDVIHAAPVSDKTYYIILLWSRGPAEHNVHTVRARCARLLLFPRIRIYRMTCIGNAVITSTAQKNGTGTGGPGPSITFTAMKRV